jgi:hypothetical protein
MRQQAAAAYEHMKSLSLQSLPEWWQQLSGVCATAYLLAHHNLNPEILAGLLVSR